jgi:hypothetical protein
VHPYLDTPAFADLMSLIFPHVATNLPANHRETIVRTLAEKMRYSIVYINQAINSHNLHQQDNSHTSRLESVFASLVQSLKALSIVFRDASTKAQFVHEHNQLLTSLADMAQTVSEEVAKNGPDLTPSSSPNSPSSSPFSGINHYLKSRPRVQDFLKLVSVVSS